MRVKCPRCSGVGVVMKTGQLEHGDWMHRRCRVCHGNRTVERVVVLPWQRALALTLAGLR